MLFIQSIAELIFSKLNPLFYKTPFIQKIKYQILLYLFTPLFSTAKQPQGIIRPQLSSQEQQDSTDAPKEKTPAIENTTAPSG